MAHRARPIAAAAASTLPLRQPQQRQPRLGSNPPSAGAPVCPLCRCELTSQPVHLGLLVECRGRGSLRDSLSAFAGTLRLLDRALPVTMQLQDLGAMDPADPRKGRHFRLAPTRQGGGPLAGATERVHRLACLDDAAVHQTGHEQRQLPGGDRDHNLVQQRQPLLHASLFDPYPALLVTRAGDQVRVAAALADHPQRVPRMCRQPPTRRHRSAVPPPG